MVSWCAIVHDSDGWYSIFMFGAKLKAYRTKHRYRAERALEVCRVLLLPSNRKRLPQRIAASLLELYADQQETEHGTQMLFVTDVLTHVIAERQQEIRSALSTLGTKGRREINIAHDIMQIVQQIGSSLVLQQGKDQVLDDMIMYGLCDTDQQQQHDRSQQQQSVGAVCESAEFMLRTVLHMAAEHAQHIPHAELISAQIEIGKLRTYRQGDTTARSVPYLVKPLFTQAGFVSCSDGVY
jgi:hypothetical protein